MIFLCEYFFAEYVKSLADKYDFSLTLNNNQQKGYHIVMVVGNNQKRRFKISDLPREFIQVTKES